MENGYLRDAAGIPIRYPVYGEPLVPFHTLSEEQQEARQRWAFRHSLPPFQLIDLVPVRNLPLEMGGSTKDAVSEIVVPHDPCVWNDVQSGRVSFRAYVAANGGAPRMPPKNVIDLTGASAAAPAANEQSTYDALADLM